MLNSLPRIRYDIAMDSFSLRASNRQKLEVAKKLAWLLDSSFQIPGTSQRIGLESLLGLLPVAGDVIAFTLSLYIIYLGMQMGMPRGKLLFMVLNAILDTLLGSIPILGDLFDMFWKANILNIRLMEGFFAQQEAKHEHPLSPGTRQESLPPGMRTIDVAPEYPRTNKS